MSLTEDYKPLPVDLGFSRAGPGARLVPASYPGRSSFQVIGPVVFLAPLCLSCCQSLPVALLYSGRLCTFQAGKQGTGTF